MLVLRRRHWTPRRLRGIVTWFDATTIINVVDGGAVGTWPDLIHGYDATEAVNKPTYQTNIINGLPVVYFVNGAAKKLVANGMGTLAQPITFHAVIKAVVTTATHVYWDSSAGPNFDFLVAAGPVWGFNGGSGFSSATATDTTAHVVQLVVNGANSAMYLDGISIKSGDAGSNSLTTGLVLGNFESPSTSLVAAGYIGEHVMQQAAATTAELIAERARLKTKWATP